ncbi:MAG: hypothetical protein AB7F31_01225 [Parachlamydiales bacterium]
MGNLFFALETHAPWPENFPAGRVLDEEARHLTLAFLGNAPLEKALEIAQELEAPFAVGKAALIDRLVFLPERHPHVAAYHFELLQDLSPYAANLVQRCLQAGLTPSHPDRPLLNHITIAREPRDFKAWKETFIPLPCYLGDLHLYESLGASKYRSHYRIKVRPPFEEIPHTADIAFHIWGETPEQLHLGALLALGFHYPPVFGWPTPQHDLTEIIIALNAQIAETDAESGCPFKAVSFHGEIVETEGLLHWEMIVDV